MLTPSAYEVPSLARPVQPQWVASLNRIMISAVWAEFAIYRFRDGNGLLERDETGTSWGYPVPPHPKTSPESVVGV
jgi:hypothetical protein